MQLFRLVILGLSFFFLAATPGILGASSITTVEPNPFQDDLSMLEAQLGALEELECWVQQTHATQTQLIEEGHDLALSLLKTGDLSSTILGSAAPSGERLLGIPGFLWGFCCSIIGMFLVYVAIDDPASRKKEGAQAIYGCAAGTLVVVGLYLWALYYFSYY